MPPSKHQPSVVAIVTARGGSKRFPGKNLALLNGKPLIRYSIDAAVDCPLVTETWVTTDCDRIGKVSRESGAGVIQRPAELAGDVSTSYDTVVHALNYLRNMGKTFDYFALLQPTSPMRNATHLTEAIETLFTNRAANSLVSVCEHEHSPYKSFVSSGGYIEPLFSREKLNLPSQQLPKVLRQNGAIYVIPTEAFLSGPECFFVEPALAYEMPVSKSIDIDTPDDLLVVEALMAKSLDSSSA